MQEDDSGDNDEEVSDDEADNEYIYLIRRFGV